MKLHCVSFLIIFIFGNVAGVPLKLLVPSKKNLMLSFFPVDQESFLSILSSSDSLNFLSTMMQADPEKINEIIILLDNMILEAQKGHDDLNNAKELAAQELADADEELSQASIAEVAAKTQKDAADDRLTKATKDITDQMDKLQQELEILLKVQEQLQGIQSLQNSDLELESGSDIQKSKTPVFPNAPVSLLSVLANADPVKLGIVMDGVEQLIEDTRNAISGLNTEQQEAQEEVNQTTEKWTETEQVLTEAHSKKDIAQEKYDEAESNLTGKEKREVEILEQVKAMLQTLLPDGFAPASLESQQVAG